MSRMYRFAEFLLDPWRHTLSRANSPIFLTPKAFDLLVYLVQNPNRLVSKEELLQAVWQDTFVEAGNLTQYISHLRKALGDKPEDARWIVTIARKGYQFTGDVAVSDEAGPERQAAGQVPVTEQSYASPASDVPETGVDANTPRPWRKSLVVALSFFVLAAVVYLSWRHFRSPELSGNHKIRLAVLPFENLTGDPNKEYVADGLTEEMTSQLGRLNPQQLKVIARTSVMGYKHSEVRLDQIGRDLSVEYVLENSLRESGDHMRLTAQLVQVKDQTHLWSQDYDYPVKDILNVEEDVAKSVARQIQVRLTSQEQAGFSRPRPVNPEAFEAYLQGFYFFERNTDKDTDMAAKYLERATQLDPSYALAWVWLSRVRNWQVNAELIPGEEGHQLARQAIERALELDPNLAEAHTQMGRIKQQVDFDWVGADASFQRAVELEPGNPETVREAAFSAEVLGRFDKALQLDRRAVELDPLNAESWGFLAETEFFMGHLDGAVTDDKKALELNPDVWQGPIQLSQIYVMQGRPQNALAEVELVRNEMARAFLYAVAYYALGRQKEADAALNGLIAKHHADAAYQIAEVYAFRKQSNEAFKWLDQAYAQRDSGLIGTNVDPLLKSLHSDPRFATFLKTIHLPN